MFAGSLLGWMKKLAETRLVRRDAGASFRATWHSFFFLCTANCTSISSSGVTRLQSFTLVGGINHSFDDGTKSAAWV